MNYVRKKYIAFYVNYVFKQCIKLNLKLKETIREFPDNIQNERIIRMSKKNGKCGNNCKIVYLFDMVSYVTVLGYFPNS